jgi:OOP family OmpA-OmpF porin
MTCTRIRLSRLPAAFLASALALALASGTASAGEPDKAGSRDHPLLTRMNGMHIISYRTLPFTAFDFKTGKGKDDKASVEGQLFEIRYTVDKGVEAPAPLAIQRNHQQAVKAIGGAVVFEDGRYTTLKVARNGMETWVLVDTAWGKGYQLTVVEKKGMAQEVVADAASLLAGLRATGHVQVPGIFFDTGKSVLKPESTAAVGEVAKLLAAEPDLKVFVVGHTDGVASVDLNLELSQARAEAVVRTLTAEHGIAAARMLARGVGPFAPVASNDAEEGRARNRRVELVKQ